MPVTPDPTSPPLAVTFDFWDTLVQAPTAAATRAARRARLAGVLRRVAPDLADEHLDQALAAVRRRFDEYWNANTQFTGVEATALLLRDLGLADAGDQAWHEAAAAAFMGTDDPHLPDLTVNIEPTLRALRARDVRIGIICDVGLSPSTVLRSYLERHGVLDLFDHWSFSDEVGVYKPDPTIFEHALTGLGGIAPERAAHVGDLRRTDIAGARAFGMTAVRYAGSNDDAPDPARTATVPAPTDTPGEGDAAHATAPAPVGMAPSAAHEPEGHHVISDHADLLRVLGWT